VEEAGGYMWRVAVIGAGTMGTVHASAYTHMDGVELVGIVDIRENEREQLANQSQTQSFASLEELLEEVSVDVIDICVPTYLHRAYIEQAAMAKKHVICEKPIALTLEDARAAIQACDDAGVNLFIGHVVRFFPEYRMAREMVQQGSVGRVGTVRTMRGGGFPTAWEDWYAGSLKSGTLVVDMIIHDFDFLRWCFGEVTRVFAKSTLGRELNRIDHAFVSLRFGNGVIGHVEGTWAYPTGFRTELEIAGDQGIIQHNSDDAVSIKTAFRGRSDLPTGVAVPESPLEKSPYQLELEHFIHCLTTGEQPLVTAADGYKALEISLAALESVRTGQPVELDGRDKQ
jgi:UDP-N-acetylglucosamine 3-dehydrogenase